MYLSLINTPLRTEEKNDVQKPGRAQQHLLTLAALAVTERIWSPFSTFVGPLVFLPHGQPASCENSQRALCRTYPSEFLSKPELADLGGDVMKGLVWRYCCAALHHVLLLLLLC